MSDIPPPHHFNLHFLSLKIISYSKLTSNWPFIVSWVTSFIGKESRFCFGPCPLLNLEGKKKKAITFSFIVCNYRNWIKNYNLYIFFYVLYYNLAELATLIVSDLFLSSFRFYSASFGELRTRYLTSVRLLNPVPSFSTFSWFPCSLTLIFAHAVLAFIYLYIFLIFENLNLA